MNYNSAKSALYKHMYVIKLQLILLSVCLIVSLLSWNVYIVLSSLFGGLLIILPTLVYIKVSGMNKVLPVGQVFGKHQRAELFKFFTNFVGFAVVFIFFKHVHVLALFTTYVVTLSSYWLSLRKYGSN